MVGIYAPPIMEIPMSANLCYTRKNHQLVATLIKTGFNNILLHLLFTVVNNIVQHC